MMRALSLSQPWAHVVAHQLRTAVVGPKIIENRPEAICAAALKQRGQRVALHAAKSWDERGAEFIGALDIELPPRAEMASGAVIGAFTVVDVFRYEWALAMRALGKDPIPVDARAWAFGPLCILLRDVVTIERPIPCRGMLGFWTLPAEVEADLVRQLGAAA